MDLTGAGISGGESGEIWRNIDITSRGRHWAYRLEELERLDSIGRIHWPKKKGGMPRLKQYPEDLPRVPLQDVWNDIKPLHNLSQERLGYPTQKPVALLERIIQASSNEGDLVLDPFCGCGTTISAAEKLNRNWIGIDITHLAIALIEKRLQKEYPNQVRPYEVHGIPTNVSSAKKLAETDRFEFQDWIIEYGLGGVSNPTKVGDGGYDGYMTFQLDKDIHTVLIEVKSGNINIGMVRSFINVVHTKKASMGCFITLQPPTKGMITEVNDAGFFLPDIFDGQYHKIVIMTVEEILNGKAFPHPATEITTFKGAKTVKKKTDQIGLEFDK